MKTQTAWNELRRILSQEGHADIVGTMDKLEKADEPEYVYRMVWKSSWGKDYTIVGSKHRIVCNLNVGYGYRNKENIRVERAPSDWTDVTEDFRQWLG